MLFAKVLLLVAILVVIALAVYLRVRAWRTRKREARDRWNAELARDLGER